MQRLLASPHLVLLLAQLFWAGNAIAGRAAVGHLPPIALAFWRWALALVILLPFALPTAIHQGAAIRRQWKFLVALAAASVATYNTFLYLALTTSTAVNTTLVSATIPVAIAALSWLWLGQRLDRRQSGGLLLSLAGVVLVIARGDPAALAALRFHQGDLWALAAVASWAVYSVMLRRHPCSLDPATLLLMQVSLGLLWMLPPYLLEWRHSGGFTLDLTTASLITYVATFPSLLAYAFWNRGVTRLGPQIAGLYTNLIPVFTALLATLLLHEQIQWFHAAGLVLIVGGIWTVTRPPQPRQLRAGARP
ncbi:MAG: DMT family transporter [Azospirillaceae bacterium]|nr:DMT family transporter [Azospirillaceae bacterium]